MEEITYPATYLVHWPSNPAYVCEKHKNQLLSVAEVLGIDVRVELCGDGHECLNCVNEIKAPREP